MPKPHRARSFRSTRSDTHLPRLSTLKPVAYRSLSKINPHAGGPGRTNSNDRAERKSLAGEGKEEDEGDEDGNGGGEGEGSTEEYDESEGEGEGGEGGEGQDSNAVIKETIVAPNPKSEMSASASRKPTKSEPASSDEGEEDEGNNEEEEALVMRKGRRENRDRDRETQSSHQHPSAPSGATQVKGGTRSRDRGGERESRQGRSRDRSRDRDRISRRLSSGAHAHPHQLPHVHQFIHGQQHPHPQSTGMARTSSEGAVVGQSEKDKQGPTHTPNHNRTNNNTGGFSGFTMTEFNKRARERVESTKPPSDTNEATSTPMSGEVESGETIKKVQGRNAIESHDEKDLQTTNNPVKRPDQRAENRRSSYPFPRLTPEKQEEQEEQEERPQSPPTKRPISRGSGERQESQTGRRRGQIKTDVAESTRGVQTPPSETATLNASTSDLGITTGATANSSSTAGTGPNPVNRSSPRPPRFQASTPPTAILPLTTTTSSDQHMDLPTPSSMSRHIRTRNSHSSLKSLTSLRGSVPPHPLSSPSGARRRVTSFARQLVAPPQIDTAQAVFHSSGSGNASASAGGDGHGMHDEGMQTTSSRLPSGSMGTTGMVRSGSTRSLYEPGTGGGMGGMAGGTFSRQGGAAASQLRKASFSSTLGTFSPEFGRDKSDFPTNGTANTNTTTSAPSTARLTARGVAEAVARLPATTSRGFSSSNSPTSSSQPPTFVSRFVSASRRPFDPTPYPNPNPNLAYPGQSHAQSQSQSQSQAEKDPSFVNQGGLFVDSVYAASHISLCRTLREEGAIFIQPGTSVSVLEKHVQGNLGALTTTAASCPSSSLTPLNTTNVNETTTSGITTDNASSISNLKESSSNNPNNPSISTTTSPGFNNPNPHFYPSGSHLRNPTDLSSFGSSNSTSGVVGDKGAVIWGLTPLEMSVYRCLEQRKGAVKLSTGGPLGPLGGCGGVGGSEQAGRVAGSGIA